ncbi:MAG TPA: hypothetical protein VG322_09100 [Candidatus Acidoferrales bacterium]|nr:hypothetical protein [Candidatus Acidoferrales bacterium]
MSKPGDESQASETLLNLLLELGEFVRRFRANVQFRDLSRAHLELLRVELKGSQAECEWMAQAADKWDAGLPRAIAERNASTQALRDALAVRELLFQVLPGLQSAALRVYRSGFGRKRELVISGEVTREETAPESVQSVAMRAKLLGLQFEMNEGILEELRQEVCEAHRERFGKSKGLEMAE